MNVAADLETVPDLLRGRARLEPSRPFARFKERAISYGDVNAAMGAELVPLSVGERVGMLLPLFHANAQVVTCLMPMMIGCEIVLWERFSASTFLADGRRAAAGHHLGGADDATRARGLHFGSGTDGADRAFYARTKRSLASLEWTYMQQYADAKTDVVKEIMLRAQATE